MSDTRVYVAGLIIDGVRDSRMTHELEIIERKSSLPTERPPLLFVHGSAHGAWCWAEHFLGFFAGQGFSAYALSLRGHGGSGGRERLRWASIADYVDDVARVAATLPGAPVVAGHSLGGMVVQQYLERHVAPAAVLLAPAPPGGNRRQAARMALHNPWLALESLLTLEPGRGFSTPARARRFLFSPELDEEAVRRYVKLLGRESFRAIMELGHLRPDATRVRRTPLLVLGAERDYIVSPADVRRTAEAYGAEMRILPDIAHDVMLDPGWRRAADAMLEWLIGTLASHPAGRTG